MSLHPARPRCNLSPIQEGLLFHAIYGGDPTMYISQVCCRFGADFQPAVFEQAWSLMIDRHAILRTSFVWERTDAPAQIVEPQVPLPLRVLDITGLDEAGQEARIESVLRDERERGFRPDEAPLMRLTRFDLGAGRHEYAWTYHHLIMDAWSEARLVSEITAVYAALSEGRGSSLGPASPYSAYVAWLERQDLKAAEAHWRRMLAGLSAGLCVGRPDAGDSGTEAIEIRWPDALALDLAKTAREQRVTSATLLLGAWALLLSSLSGAADVVFGQAVSGRPADLPDVEHILGPFINTLPLRVTVRRSALVGSWLRALQQQQLEQRPFEHTPLVRVQGWSDVPRGVPLFDTLFVFQNPTMRPPGGFRPAALAPTRVRTGDGPTHYALSADVRPGPPLAVTLTCDRSRIDDVTRTSLGPAVQALVEALPAAMDAPVETVLAAADAARARARAEALRALSTRVRQSLGQAVRKTVVPHRLQETPS